MRMFAKQGRGGLRSKEWQATAYPRLHAVYDYEEKRQQQYDLLSFAMEWREEKRGSSTCFSKPEGSTEGTGHFWNELCALVDPRISEPGTELRGLDRFVLSAPAKQAIGSIELLDGQRASSLNMACLWMLPGASNSIWI